ncbi:MAG: hypothetical protein A2015_03385 [Spirochaetes bacterium GWF1_31_7]|nr:MAG: hypothetical protein A2Y30_07470 [Spirochaetes bacterium GWE1_32_154]OHD48424.1 MAG: hypothetical protein A2Y29_05345 [Spirochaetes bacterium GWE2_31_10]OHD50900.1 MAG: hypothetical protein A2015_03385 [Spirochaetes bacterium GWF1_31_7]OHD79579.1 MAG: hypothetical protein A2355_03875 [Spirochaetes bacterium RIFOXYB1_FULL_32_8]HBD92739.1 hypothetical protein [Spirochaetia bacterium]
MIEKSSLLNIFSYKRILFLFALSFILILPFFLIPGKRSFKIQDPYQGLLFPSGICRTGDDSFLLTDNGDSRLLHINNNGIIKFINNGKNRHSWYSGSIIGTLPDGKTLLLDTIPDLKSGLPVKSKVILLKPDGAIIRNIVTIDYPEELSSNWESHVTFPRISNNDLVFFRKIPEKGWLLFRIPIYEIKNQNTTINKDLKGLSGSENGTFYLLPNKFDPYSFQSVSVTSNNILFALNANGNITTFDLINNIEETWFDNADNNIFMPNGMLLISDNIVLINDAKKRIIKITKSKDRISREIIFDEKIYKNLKNETNVRLSIPAIQSGFDNSINIVNEYDGSLIILTKTGKIRLINIANSGLLLKFKEYILTCLYYLGILLIIFAVITLYYRILKTMTPLLIKQIMIIAPLLIILTIAGAVVVFNNNKDQLEIEIEKRLSLLSQVGMKQLDSKDFESLQFENQPLATILESEGYRKISKLLASIVNDNEDSWNMDLNAYIYRFDGIDWWIIGSYDYTELYPYPKQSFYKVLHENKIIFTRYDDVFGSWLSSFSPIQDESGNITGLFEITTSASILDEGEIIFIRNISFILILMIVLILLVLGFFNYLLLKSVRVLQLGTTKIAKGEFDTIVSINSHDEMEILGTNFNKMSDDLRLNLERILMLNKMNSRFVPNVFINHLGKKSIEYVKLGDQIEESMTVLFTDIRSFTTISEQMSPVEIFAFINEYLALMGPVVRKRNGFIDKYIGDAIMALFPGEPDDALLAVLDMTHLLAKMNEKRKHNGLFPVQIGAGINTGRCMLGIIGESERYEGTVLSDTVNLSSRLESLTVYYGVSVLIGEETIKGLSKKDHFHIRLIDKVKVKGKNNATSIYELITPMDPEYKSKIHLIPHYTRAFSLYEEGRFIEAQDLFQEIITTAPGDGASILMKQRCRKFLETGTPKDWNGVTVFNVK